MSTGGFAANSSAAATNVDARPAQQFSSSRRHALAELVRVKTLDPNADIQPAYVA